MTTPPPVGPGSGVQRSAGGGLADVVETILDKGIVIDAFVRVSLVGIEVITIDARVVVASVDTYLRFAQATNRLDLYEKGRPGVVGEITERGTEGTTKGMLSAAEETIEETLDERRDDEEPEPRRPRRPRRERES